MYTNAEWRRDVTFGFACTGLSEVVKFSGNAVDQFLAPILGGAEEQHRAAILHCLVAQAHDVVVISLQKIHTNDDFNDLISLEKSF